MSADEKLSPSTSTTRTKSTTMTQIKVSIPRYERIGIKIKPKDIKLNTGAVLSRFSEPGEDGKIGAVEKAGNVRPGMVLVAISEVNVQGMDTSSIVSFLRHRHKISDLICTFISSTTTENKVDNTKRWQSLWGAEEVTNHGDDHKSSAPLDYSPSSTYSRGSRRSSIDIDGDDNFALSSNVRDRKTTPRQRDLEKTRDEDTGISYESLIEKTNRMKSSQQTEDQNSMNSSSGSNYTTCKSHPCENVSVCILQ
jgi:hypothetical protein